MMKQIIKNLIKGLLLFVVGFMVLDILLSFPIVIVFEFDGVLFYIALSLWVILMIIITILLSINFYKILDKIFK